MTDATPPAAPAPVPDPAASPPARVRGRKRAFTYRWTRRLLLLVVGLIAALLVSLFTLDLGRVDIGGRSLKRLAEEEGTKYLKRPLRIGSIKALLWPGTFELRDVVIEGLNPGDRPFLTAKSIGVNVQWRTLFAERRQLFLDVDMADWQMVMEIFRDGRHNLPRFTPEPRPDQPPRQRNFTTTFSVTARGGHYTFHDHGTPWSVVAPNLSFNMYRDDVTKTYVGNAEFKQGTVQIQDFKPMQAAMTTRFAMGEGGRFNLQHIDLLTDGAVSHLSGYVQFGKGRPDQHYEIRSTVDFARMRDIFFAGVPWRLGGEGQFRGLFEVFSAGGFQLGGQFWSDLARVNELAFANLHGTLEWQPKRFAVTHAEAEFHGGPMTFAYAIPRTASGTTTLDVAYEDVNLTSLGRQFDLGGLNLVGRAGGFVNLAWPNGRFSQARGAGELRVTPPPGIPTATVDLPSTPLETSVRASRGNPPPPLTALAFGASVLFQIDPERLTFEPSWAATPSTYVSFGGQTGWGERSNIPFHVTSHDWQESDRVLAAVLTAFGNRTGTFTVGGRGTFDGTMTESFRASRIAGRFDAQEMYAWDVNWGRASGDLVIQNSYLDIINGVMGSPDGPFIRADGRFSLGYPRKDAGEEMNGRIVVKDWPLLDVKTAFEQQDWPVDGTIAHADLTLHGPYDGLFGGGDLLITNGVAWDEPFESAKGQLQFEGTGVFVQRMEIAKAKGWLRGSAQLFWSGRFAFDAEGDRIPVESLDNFRVEGLPLTGMLRIRQVTGKGTFEQPRYEVDASVADLYLGDEGIGHVTGRLVMTHEELTLTSLEVASQRLAISGTGTIKLNELYDSKLSFVITDASIDPYLKFVGAAEVSPYTRITVQGSTQISGPLADPSRLNVGITITKADVTLLDYTLENPPDEPVVLTFANNIFQIGKLRLQNLPDPLRGIKEKDTSLVLSGGVNVGARTVDIRADGDASLAVMQLFFTDLSASGSARVQARIEGPFEAFGILGDAHITNGTIRSFGLPHSLTNLNGPITFARDAIDVGGLTARVGDGDVDFEGRILLAEGYQPREFDVTAKGTSMRLRYPPGVRSTVNMDLGLTGPINGPLLSGTITVLALNYSPRVEDQTAIIGIASGGAAAALGPLDPTGEPGAFPLRLDITIDMDTQPIIEHQAGFIDASAHLRFTGTYDRPALTGQVDIERGEYSFAGNRYFVRRGTIDFTNTGRIQPVFDVQAETRARAAGQTFQVGIRLSGTFDRITPTLTSDPWLPDEEIVSLLLGGTPDLGRLEQRQLGSPQQAQERMLQNAAAVLLTSPISSRLGSAFTDALPLTSLQITPTLGGTDSLQQLSPSARITVGQRISNNVFLTYSVALNDAQSELILVEYDQSDRLSWVLSRNGDRTFALDFRIRYVF